ncbi:lactate permease [Pseudomonadota bacterium 24LQ007]
MSSRAERYRRRKNMVEKNRAKPLGYGVVDQERVHELLNQDVDQAKLIRYQYSTELAFPIEADSAEVNRLLSELRSSFHQQRLDDVLGSLKKEVIASIAGPFGLGKILSAYDKAGGNVDTIHNAREGVYATDDECRRYDDRGEYDSSSYHGHSEYIAKNRQDTISQDNGTLRDSYTGEVLAQNKKRNLDHTISAKEVHEDAGRVLAEVNGPTAANSKSNLNPTSEHINNTSGKGALTTDEFLAKLERQAPERRARIEELAAKPELSTKESRELERFREHEAVDADRMRQIDQDARKEYDAKINKKYYTSKKFASNTIKTGVDEGAKMGVQQAIGLLLVEFLSNSFIEIKQSFNQGLEGETLMHDIRIRLERIGKKCASKWKDMIEGFSGGFISGFISNLVTTLVNVFITTSKRFVRMIREGVFSLLKALKLILFPPSNMTFLESMHEATKLFAAGGIVIAGVALEEVIEKFVLSVPALAPIATLVTSVLVGSLTAISMALISYLIDKTDLLGVIKIEQSKFVLNSLDESIENRLKRCEELVAIQ